MLCGGEADTTGWNCKNGGSCVVNECGRGVGTASALADDLDGRDGRGADFVGHDNGDLAACAIDWGLDSVEQNPVLEVRQDSSYNLTPGRAHRGASRQAGGTVDRDELTRRDARCIGCGTGGVNYSVRKEVVDRIQMELDGGGWKGYLDAKPWADAETDTDTTTCSDCVLNGGKGSSWPTLAGFVAVPFT